jgi:hypothetical protein
VSSVVPADRLTEDTMTYARLVAEAPLEALKAVKAGIVRETPFRVP